jgi:hypothetical protein
VTDETWSSKVNPNPATAEEQIADLDAHYPGGFQAWYMEEPVPTDEQIELLEFRRQFGGAL